MFGFLTRLAVVLLLITSTASAAGPELNLDRAGLALRGFDPVAYFSDGQPKPGKAEITAVHDGASYRFTTTANRDAFVAAPEKFLPQYGGYCAYASALGKKADGDPAIWKIVDGKLYLNYNRSIGERWGADIPGYVEKADRRWPEIKGKTSAELN